MTQGLSKVDDDFSICFPGIMIPEWFTYKNLGDSISVSLPQNWYNDKFMGFALCIISELRITSTSWRSCKVSKIFGIDAQFRFRSHDGCELNYSAAIGCTGTMNLDSELTCLAYVSFDEKWLADQDKFRSPNELCQIEVSGYYKMVYTGFGMRLVYEDDVKQSSDETLVLHNESSQSRKIMGVFSSFLDRTPRRKREYPVSIYNSGGMEIWLG